MSASEEEELTSRELSINYLKRLKGSRQISKEAYQSIITNLTKECFLGFTEEEVNTLIDCLLTIQQGGVRFKELITCIVPEHKVPRSATVRVLNWLFTNYLTAPLNSITVTLQWIAGLLDFGLTEEEPLQGFYQHYFLLFQRQKLIPFACKLLYLLTKPSFVSRWRVKKVLKVERSFGKKSHTSALLCLFKCYKPECVPENIPAVSAQHAFKTTESRLSYRFEKAQLRVRVRNGERGQWYKALQWNLDVAMRKAGKRRKLDIMPSLDYVRFGASIYAKEELYSILEFNNLESLGCFQLSLEMPSNAMALLQNVAGLHILTFGDSAIQTRLAYNLYYCLHRAFLEKDVEYSYEEKDKLLTQVVALQEYLQQGVPVVSRFLGQYLLTWDGEDFKDNILKLLQWISFSVSDELQKIVFSPIKTMFVTSNVSMKCSIIETLKKIQLNLVLGALYRKQKGYSNLFLDVQDTWDAAAALNAVTKLTNELCVFGLSCERDNYAFINQVLCYYEMVSEVEEKMNIPLWTMMPPLLVYSCLFTKNIIFLSRVCALLLRYRNVVYPRLRTNAQRQQFKNQINKMYEYISDFVNCLHEDRSLLRSETRYLLTKIPEKQIQSLLHVLSADEDVVLFKHIAVAPLIASSSEVDRLRSSGRVDREAIMKMLEEMYPEIVNLLEAMTQG